jgi:hypothetical protein
MTGRVDWWKGIERRWEGTTRIFESHNSVRISRLKEKWNRHHLVNVFE